MRKTEIAINALHAAAQAGKTIKQAITEAEKASGLHIYAEAATTEETAGKEYHDSLSRIERRAMFDIYARGPRGNNFSRLMARQFIAGFEGSPSPWAQ